MRRRAVWAMLLGLLWHGIAPLGLAAAPPAADLPLQIEAPHGVPSGVWLPRAAASDTLARPPQADPCRLSLACVRPSAALAMAPRHDARSPARPHRAHYPSRRLLRRRLARPGDDHPG